MSFLRMHILGGLLYMKYMHLWRNIERFYFYRAKKHSYFLICWHLTWNGIDTQYFFEHIFFLLSCWKSLNQFLLVSISFSLIQLVAQICRLASAFNIVLLLKEKKERNETPLEHLRGTALKEKLVSNPWLFFLMARWDFYKTELWGPSTEYRQHLYSEPVSMVLVCLVRAGEMAQWEKGLPGKLDDLGSNLWTQNGGRRESVPWKLHHIVFWSLHTLWCVHAHAYT